jgi:hypothetical protein
MNSTKAEVFLEAAELRVFESVKSAALAFLECKRTRLDAMMPAHLARRDAHWTLAVKVRDNACEACAEYINELIRTALAETCRGGYTPAAAYNYFRTWFITLGKTAQVAMKADRNCLGFGRICWPDNAAANALRQNVLTKVLSHGSETDPDQRFLTEFNGRLRERLGTERLLWLPEAVYWGFKLVPREEFADWLAEPPEDLQALSDTCLQRESRILESLQAAMRIENKITAAGQRLVLPVCKYVAEQAKELYNDFALALLCQLMKKTTALYKADPASVKSLDDEICYSASAAQITFQVMFQSAPHDWRAFADGVIALLEKPRAFARWNCAPEHHAVKTLLRSFAELAAGPISFPTERADLLARLREHAVSREEILSLTGQYFGLLCRDQDPTPRLKGQMDTLFKSWSADLGQWFGSIEVKEQRFRLKRADDVEFEKLLAEEVAAAAQVSEEMMRWQTSWNSYQSETDKDDSTTVPAPAAQPETIRVTYVENLGSEAWRTQAIHCSRYDFTKALDQYLTAKDIETVVPVPSIARAIEHFIFELTPEQRTLVPMERIAEEPWRKLKRGGQRIYVLEKNGEVFVHLMKRKDWCIPATQEARFQCCGGR